LAAPVDGLRNVLELERKKKYSDNAVVGGLDRFLLRFMQDSGLPSEHRFSEVLRSLPPGGYRALHVVQRKRVVEELLDAVANGLPTPPAQPERAPDPPPPPQPEPKPEVVGNLDSPVAVIKGIDPRARPLFSKIGLTTVRDLLFHFPNRHEEYLGIRSMNDLVVDQTQTIVGTVFSVGKRGFGGRRSTEATISGEGGTVKVIWWNAPWVASRLHQGASVALSGRVSAYKGRPQMDQPEFVEADDPAVKRPGIRSVYRSTEGLRQRQIRNAMRLAIDGYGSQLVETLPESIRKRNQLPALRQALEDIHFPKTLEDAETARRRFAFDELLSIEVGVVRRRAEWQSQDNAPILVLPEAIRDGFVSSLPFALTAAQKRAVAQVIEDIGRRIPMNRLLEGDVGSGKTVVATACLLAAVSSGFQGAIMAPTEILAEQHFRTIGKLLDSSHEVEEGAWFQEAGSGFVVLRPPYFERPVRMTLLKGSLRSAEKGAAQEAISSGEVDITCGTHALVQEAVGFERLGLIVVDEQHRFGVGQRAALREKGESPHVLVMTATPIPRTLQLTVFGDLDITVLDEMPPGRPEVKTWRVTPPQRDQAYEFLRKKVAEGRQAYVICPLVEESETVASKAAVQEHERLQRDVFPDLKLGLLHGRMTPTDKESVMREFRDGALDVLVSTAVVEVGVDVPNATVILIEGADRFGLAQLHQFRGRVRRSSEQAYCFLLSDSDSTEAMERLQIMETVNDGFKLAEHDLRLRGPGEYFGTKQSGLPDLKAARLTDVDLISQTREEAIRLLEEDPELASPEYTALRAEVDRRWGGVSGEVS
jgi:ATP-dependent DNA helicase RecG